MQRQSTSPAPSMSQVAVPSNNTLASKTSSTSGILKSSKANALPSGRRKSVMLGSILGVSAATRAGGMSAGEAALETTLDATTKTLSVYKERIRTLIQNNAEMQEQCAQQEKDAIEVMGAMRDDLERRDREIIALRLHIDQNRLAYEKEARDTLIISQKKIQDLNEVIVDKESNIKLMEQEVAAVKDFKKKRTEVMKELELQKVQNIETERRYKETMIRMERKFFEEKVRMQKDANRKVSELAAKAHREAIFTLDETTKEIYKENVRLSEALKSHMSAEEEATALNDKLLKQNTHLIQDKETNNQIVRDKIVQNKNKTQLVQELQSKVATLENTLSHVVREFEHEKDLIGHRAQEELATLKRVAAQLMINLDRKGQEMKYIKRLAHHILRQRTDVEKFFMDALDHVRKELYAQRVQEKVTLLQDFHRRLQDPHAPIIGRSISSSKTIQGPETPLAVPEKIEISELRWEDKEKVLRALFARMNGYIHDSDPTPPYQKQQSNTLRDIPSGRAVSFGSIIHDNIGLSTAFLPSQQLINSAVSVTLSVPTEVSESLSSQEIKNNEKNENFISSDQLQEQGQQQQSDSIEQVELPVTEPPVPILEPSLTDAAVEPPNPPPLLEINEAQA